MTKAVFKFSDEFVRGDGDALFKACAEQELEGIVSKHSLAPYRSGRSKTWLKTKCFTQLTFVVIGTRFPPPWTIEALDGGFSPSARNGGGGG